MFGRLLNRAIFSHLLVAVPPAVVLGWMVMDINARALRQESQYLHLALALQVRDAIRSEVESISALLGHAERILDLTELTIDARQAMLRALVADGRLSYLALYQPDGGFNSLVKPTDLAAVNREPLPTSVREIATVEPWGVWHRDDGAFVAHAWRRDGDVLGYLGSIVPQSALRRLCTDAAERFFGDGGRVEVIDRAGRLVLSSVGTPAAGAKNAFSMIRLNASRPDGGLAAIEAGVVGEFDNEEGDGQLAAVVSAPRLGWIVAASRPKAVAFASLGRMRFRVILMSVIAALAAGVVALIMARTISGPVQRIIRAVRRAAQRGFAPEAKVSATGELGQLAKAFNHALAQMAEYRRQVRQTTQLRLRLARLTTGSASARQLLARALSDTPGPVEMMSVLYADVDFARRESASTEHLVTILGEFFSAAHEAIRQEGGRVDRYSGDAVIGVFSAESTGPGPSAALAAARTIVLDARAISERWQEVLPVQLQAEIGVATGEAQLIADDDPTAEPTVFGDIVERAAALQRRASPGSVVLDETTANVLDPSAGARSAALGPASGDLPTGDVTGDTAVQWTPRIDSGRP